MTFTTADLCDAHSDRLQIAEPIFRDFGARIAFEGRITTVRAPEDNSLVRKVLEENGNGRVLVVDGAGSMRCALLGDQLAQLAVKNRWAGVVVNGCIRDSAVIAGLQLGVKALGTHPLKTAKRSEGEKDAVVRFAGVTFTPGHHVYADADGIVVATEKVR